MKLLLTLFTLIFTLSVNAQDFGANELESLLKKKLSETSFTIIKQNKVNYTKTSLQGMTQMIVDIEIGHIQHLKVEGDTVVEKEYWVNVGDFNLLEQDAFATATVISGSKGDIHLKMLCRAERNALNSAIDALESAVATGNQDLIDQAYNLYWTASFNLSACLMRPVTHEK